jgi:CRISPR-associated protein Cas1
MQKDGRVLYLTESKSENLFWYISIANTKSYHAWNCGTSITQAAMRMLASAGVLVRFCGKGGTSLLMANEI